MGGVDPNTALTYGFNPMTGAPEPGRNTTEPEIFAGILQALGVDTLRRVIQYEAMRRTYRRIQGPLNRPILRSLATGVVSTGGPQL